MIALDRGQQCRERKACDRATLANASRQGDRRGAKSVAPAAGSPFGRDEMAPSGPDRSLHRRLRLPGEAAYRRVRRVRPCGERARRDRDAWLRDQGFIVVRFWNHEILQNPISVARHYSGPSRPAVLKAGPRYWCARPLPLREKMARAQRETDEGLRLLRGLMRPLIRALRAHLLPQGEKGWPEPLKPLALPVEARMPLTAPENGA